MIEGFTRFLRTNAKKFVLIALLASAPFLIESFAPSLLKGAGVVWLVIFACVFTLVIVERRYDHIRRRSQCRWEIVVELEDLCLHPLMTAANEKAKAREKAGEKGTQKEFGVERMSVSQRFLIFDGLVWSPDRKAFVGEMTVKGRLLGEWLDHDDETEPTVVIRDRYGTLEVFVVPWSRSTRLGRHRETSVDWAFVRAAEKDSLKRENGPLPVKVATFPFLELVSAWAPLNYGSSSHVPGGLFNVSKFIAGRKAETEIAQRHGLKAPSEVWGAHNVLANEFVTFRFRYLDDHFLTTVG